MFEYHYLVFIAVTISYTWINEKVFIKAINRPNFKKCNKKKLLSIHPPS